MPSCKICLENFDTTRIRPVVGTCGHSICSSCSTKINGSCPICRNQYSFCNAAPNYGMIEVMEENERRAQEPSNHKAEQMEEHGSRAQEPSNHKAEINLNFCWNCNAILPKSLPLREDEVSVQCRKCHYRNIVGKLKEGNKWMISCAESHFQQFPVDQKRGRGQCQVCGKERELRDVYRWMAKPC